MLGWQLCSYEVFHCVSRVFKYNLKTTLVTVPCPARWQLVIIPGFQECAEQRKSQIVSYGDPMDMK